MEQQPDGLPACVRHPAALFRRTASPIYCARAFASSAQPVERTDTVFPALSLGIRRYPASRFVQADLDHDLQSIAGRVNSMPRRRCWSSTALAKAWSPKAGRTRCNWYQTRRHGDRRADRAPSALAIISTATSGQHYPRRCRLDQRLDHRRRGAGDLSTPYASFSRAAADARTCRPAVRPATAFRSYSPAQPALHAPLASSAVSFPRPESDARLPPRAHCRCAGGHSAACHPHFRRRHRSNAAGGKGRFWRHLYHISTRQRSHPRADRADLHDHGVDFRRAWSISSASTWTDAYGLDSTRIRNELGWTDQVWLEQGLADAGGSTGIWNASKNRRWLPSQTLRNTMKRENAKSTLLAHYPRSKRNGRTRTDTKTKGGSFVASRGSSAKEFSDGDRQHAGYGGFNYLPRFGGSQ